MNEPIEESPAPAAPPGISPEAMAQMMQMMGGARGPPSGGGGGADGGGGGGPTTIQLSAEEGEAIERLQALGFDRNTAIEAFLACDRNEQLAANFLFDSM